MKKSQIWKEPVADERAGQGMLFRELISPVSSSWAPGEA